MTNMASTRRALTVLGLAGVAVAGFGSRPAWAQEPVEPDVPANTAADSEHNTEEPKEAEKPAPVFTPAATAPPPFVPPAAPPPRAKFGDMTISGYFRGGFGASNQKGRMTCFSISNPAGLVSKYRLGNECEVWSETHFSIVTYADDDGVVATVHFMPTVYIPTTDVGYSPTDTVSSPAIFTTSTSATLSFPNLYVDIKGIPWLFGGTAWAGTRYYKRESVYISDFFYWNPSGVGGGVEDINLGKDLRLSYGLFAVDGEPGPPAEMYAPLLPLINDFGFRNDIQLRGIKPYESGELQVGFQYIADFSNHPGTTPGTSVTSSGWGATVQFVQQLLGGNNKLAFQYGRGGGTGFGTLARFYYPDFSLYFSPSESRIRVVDVLTIQPVESIGAQIAGVYQRDNNFLGNAGQNTNWYSAGGRVALGFTKHAKLLGEAGYDRITKSNGADPQELAKFTIAPTISVGRGLMTRPELRLFYTWAVWNEPARIANIDSGMIYRNTNLLSGSIFGLQAETWY
jgi:maltoporin